LTEFFLCDRFLRRRLVLILMHQGRNSNV